MGRRITKCKCKGNKIVSVEKKTNKSWYISYQDLKRVLFSNNKFSWVGRCKYVSENHLIQFNSKSKMFRTKNMYHIFIFNIDDVEYLYMLGSWFIYIMFEISHIENHLVITLQLHYCNGFMQIWNSFSSARHTFIWIFTLPQLFRNILSIS